MLGRAMRQHFEEIELSEGPADATPIQFDRECPVCGVTNDPTVVTCRACGVVIARAQRTSRAVQRNMGDARVAPPPDTSKRNLVIGGVVALVIAAVAVWFFVLRKSYLVVGPPIGKGERTVVLLHGFGAPGDALAPRAKALSERLPDITWVLPEAPHGARTGRAWVTGPGETTARESAAESRAAVSDLLEELTGSGVALDQIYLGGYSQGAQLALDYALRADLPRPGGLILLSGGLPPWPEARTLTDGELPTEAAVFLAHGAKDTLVGIEQAARLRARMVEAGMQVEFHTAPGGHDVDDGTIDALVKWLGG